MLRVIERLERMNILGGQNTKKVKNNDFFSSGVPLPPNNCSVSNQTWDSLEITCSDDDRLNGVDDDDIIISSSPLYLLTVHERMSHGVVYNITGKVSYQFHLL